MVEKYTKKAIELFGPLSLPLQGIVHYYTPLQKPDQNTQVKKNI